VGKKFSGEFSVALLPTLLTYITEIYLIYFKAKQNTQFQDLA
jgi:hypothetical protein